MGALGDIIRNNPFVDELADFQLVTARDFDFFADVTATGLNREKSGLTPKNRIDLFADQLGLDISSDPLPTYVITDDERQWAEQQVTEYAFPRKPKDITLVGIQVKSNDKRRTWPEKYTKELVKRLTRDPNTWVLLFYWETPDEGWQLPRTFICDRSLRYTAALVDQCDVIVCPDSAILHVAGALQKKTIGIFGPVPPESRINYYSNATAIVAGLPCQYCLVGESSVLTEEGYRPLQEIQEGDLVKTAHSLYKPVTKIHKNDRAGRALHELTYLGSNTPIIGTAEHKILISRKSETTKDVDICTGSNPQWIEIKDAQQGDYLCLPRNKKETTEAEALGYPGNETRRCWLFGLYLAEGHTQWHRSDYKREYSVRFTLGSHEEGLIEELKTVLESEFGSKVFINDSKQDKSTQVWINNKAVTAIFRSQFGEDSTAATKFIPSIIHNMKTSEIRAFIDGYFAGDGYLDNEGRRVYTTKSREIAYGIQELYTRLGILACVYHRIRDTNYKKNADIYRISVYDRDRHWTRWCIDKDYLYTPVKENVVSARQDEFLYDITVEDDPTFTVDNTAVNDCWYRPGCNNKVTCLKEITPTMVHEAIKTKLAEKHKMQAVITQHSRKQFKPDNIVLVTRHFGGFGDIIQSIPAIEGLAEKYPSKKIYYALPKKYWPAAEQNPVIDKLLDADKEIRNNNYSVVIDISSPCAHYESRKVRQHHPVEKSRVEVFAESLGTRSMLKTLTGKYYLTKKETKTAKEFLPPTDKIRLGVALRCAEKYRDWPIKKYEKLIPLLKQDFQTIIVDPIRKFSYLNVVDACGFPFRQSAAILNQCDMILTPDTSILHLGAALNIPTVAMFGPIDPQTRCKGYKNVKVLVADLECVPCWRNQHAICKLSGSRKQHSQCMQQLAVKDVYMALQAMRTQILEGVTSDGNDSSSTEENDRAGRGDE
jgi:ADP-heptose:LPS heptosyltransferase